MKFRPTFTSKNFQSGEQVLFLVYDKNENLVEQNLANEWSGTGVYYLDLNYNLRFVVRNFPLLIVAEEITGLWKASKILKQLDRI